jgi:hypothetical protein
MQKRKTKQKLGEKLETRNMVFTITATAQLAKEKTPLVITCSQLIKNEKRKIYQRLHNASQYLFK